MKVEHIFGIMGGIALIFTLLRFFTTKPASILVAFFQYFVGSLFIFSGFVKAVDPMGTSYKMHDYFEAMHLGFLDPLALSFSVAMITAEIALGVALLIGWKPKITTSLLLLLNVFFLLLTGYTYISGYCPSTLFFVWSILTFVLISIGAIVEKQTIRMGAFAVGIISLITIFGLMKFSTILVGCGFDNTKMKVTDCGCFGDFIKLKPWETFYKDIFLTILSIFLCLNYAKVATIFGVFSRNIITGFVTAGTFIFCLYNFLWSEPVIDFRPYAIGADININRTVVKPEKRFFTFLYTNKKSGEIKEFKTEEIGNLNAEEWTYKDRKDVVLDEGIPAKITNLNIFNADHEEMTEDLLHDENYSLAIVAYKLSLTDAKTFKEKLNPLAAACEKAKINCYVLTSESYEDFRHANQTAYPFYTADETPLKTIMRSNPGLVLLKNGVLINKWHKNNLPTYEELNTLYFKK